MTVSVRTLRFVAELVKAEAGIIVSQEKDYLVQSRLAPLARRHGCRDVDALVNQLQARPDRRIQEQVVEAMTTNETTFFRDLHPFQALKEEILPAAIEANRGRRSLRVWSAAASTGQEAYTLAMILADDFPELDRWDVQIVASDISEEVLEVARRGRYAQHEVNRGLPAPKLVKHFQQDGREWVLDPAIRRRVEFSRVNLIAPFPSWLPTFDVVLLRNVLIYFEPTTKAQILGRVRRHLTPGGLVMLGAAETTLGIDPCYERVTMGSASVYRVAQVTAPTRGTSTSPSADHRAL